MAVAAAAIGAVAYTGFANSAEPLALILREIGQPWAARVLGASAVIALPTVILAFFYGQSRIFFTVARDGLLRLQPGACVEPRHAGADHRLHRDRYVGVRGADSAGRHRRACQCWYARGVRRRLCGDAGASSARAEYASASSARRCRDAGRPRSAFSAAFICSSACPTERSCSSSPRRRSESCCTSSTAAGRRSGRVPWLRRCLMADGAGAISERRPPSPAAHCRAAGPGGARQLADGLQRRRRQLAHRDGAVDPRPSRDPASRSFFLHLGGQAVGADRMAGGSVLRVGLSARWLQRHGGAGDGRADGAPRHRLLQRRRWVRARCWHRRDGFRVDPDDARPAACARHGRSSPGGSG